MDTLSPEVPQAFDEFVREQDVSLSLLAREIEPMLPTRSQPSADEFARELHQIAFSPEFLKDVSNEIGLPSERDGEEAFVQRGLSVIRRKLYQRFGLRGTIE